MALVKASITRLLRRTLTLLVYGHHLLVWVVNVLERLLPEHSTLAHSRRWQGIFSKKYLVHAAFLTLMLAIAFHSNIATGADRSSLLYALVAGDEVVEGPLDPAAYAQTDTPGVGGARLAAIDAGSGIDVITFEDPEVDFAGALGGNAVVGPLMPEVPEPGTEAIPQSRRTHEPQIYTVADGDTIASIAAAFNVSANTIVWANGLNNQSMIKVGDHLTILPTTGVLHTVRSGDTVSEIATKYDAKSSDIMDYNGLNEDAKLSLGQKVIVPDGYIAPQKVPTIVSRNTQIADRDSTEGPTPEPTVVSGEGFAWPTTTKHISQYFRWGHTGIDIDNRSMPAVYAASTGTVEFAGWLGGYGNLIILNHGNGVQTYYAHLSKFYVSVGTPVAKGAAIAQMGSTGHSTGPHVHFEVRKGGRPINPLGMY